MKDSKLTRIIMIVCSVSYLWFLIKIILLKNGFSIYHFNTNLSLFDFINQYYQSGLSLNLLINVLGNIALFIPLGIILLHYFDFLTYSNVIFISLFTSLSFEMIQLATGWGVFDVDDILLNTIGGIIGILIYHGLIKFDKWRCVFLVGFGALGFVSLYSYCPTFLMTLI